MAGDVVRLPGTLRIGSEDRILRMFVPLDPVETDGEPEGGVMLIGGLVTSIPHQVGMFGAGFDDVGIKQIGFLPVLIESDDRFRVDPPFQSLLGFPLF